MEFSECKTVKSGLKETQIFEERNEMSSKTDFNDYQMIKVKSEMNFLNLFQF